MDNASACRSVRRIGIVLYDGFSPLEYLLRVRVDRACRLLIETDFPVETIARLCGMGNSSRLGKIFRKKLLMPPTAYRLRNKAP